MTTNKRRSKKITLAAGRPPKVHKAKAQLSAAATRTLIRSHHRLHKELHKANATKDQSRAQALQAEIDALGGLESYQQASILGQSKDRGGDSSLVLIQWLKPVEADLRKSSVRPRLLEVGALSTMNACSRSKLFDVERIDLNSQGEGILRQDFMQRPLPTTDSERFDIISLSLVLNYVPDAAGRGEMLKRTCQFLRPQTMSSLTLPALFLVLPAPCVTNSRYLNTDLLDDMMTNIGYRCVSSKQTTKLVYYLWQFEGARRLVTFQKAEVNPGAGRNNFAIVLNT